MLVWGTGQGGGDGTTAGAEGRFVASADAARHVLSTDAGGVLSARGRPTRTRRFPVELRVEVDGGTTALQEVMLEIGLPESSVDAQCPLSLVPAAHTGLLPGLRGTLALLADGEGTILRIRGSRPPPLGRLGAFGDGLIGSGWPGARSTPSLPSCRDG